MDKQQFGDSIQLFEALGEMKLGSGQNLRAELRLGMEISLWEVVATYLVLYRFPLLFSQRSIQPYRHRFFGYPILAYQWLTSYLRGSASLFPRQNNTGCSQWYKGGSTVLFLGFSPLFYRDVLQPVVELLIRKSPLQGIVIGVGPYSAPAVDTYDRIRFQSWWEHWDNDLKCLAQIIIKRLETARKILLKQAEFNILAQNTKIHFDRVALRHEFTQLFRCEFKRLIPQVVAARHILKRHRPALIISADDADQRCRVYLLLGRAYGIPSLVVQQGLTSPFYPEWKFFSADAIAAMGETSRSGMLAQGVTPERITVTGNPEFDCFLTPQPDACVRLRTDLGVTNGQYMLLFASQPYYVGAFSSPDIRRLMIDFVIQAAASVKNIRLVIKPHPAEDVQELKALVGASSQAVVLDQTTDIALLVKACDILITFFSTSALQALYIGKPVINVYLPGSDGTNLYLESGATWIARSPEEIAAQLYKLTSETRSEEIAKRDAARKRFVYKWAHLADGGAAERVAQLALALLAKREK